MFNKITVLGVGLLGASFSLTMKKHKLCSSITGFGRNIDNLKRAKDLGIIDSYERDAAAACRNADLIMFSTPVGTFIDLAIKIANFLKPGTIVTDVGSVKGDLVYKMEKAFTDNTHFIGSHPIAGSDRSGISAATDNLFYNAKCIVTPTEYSNKSALEKVILMWEKIGCKVELMDAHRHDRVYAAISHLPHLIAFALVNSVSDYNYDCLYYAGQGFKDTTRIAASSSELWKDICIFNKNNILDAIDCFQKRLETLKGYLMASDSESLEKEFNNARTLRKGIG